MLNKFTLLDNKMDRVHQTRYDIYCYTHVLLTHLSFNDICLAERIAIEDAWTMNNRISVKSSMPIYQEGRSFFTKQGAYQLL